MSKGGGGSTESTTHTSNLPEYAQPYYEDLLSRTGYESSVPYETYGGSRLQNFTGGEQEAMARFRELGMSGTPDSLNNAGLIASAVGLGNPYASQMTQGTSQAQSRLGGPAYQSGYGARGDFDTGSLENNQLQGYMNPYQQQVTDINKREAMRDSEIMGANIGLDAAGQGSLGGYREAIMQSERQRNLGQELGDIQNRGSQDAFLNAQQSFEADRGAGFNAYSAGEDARQQQERLRSAGTQMGYDAASQSAQLGMDNYSNLLRGGDQQLQAAGMMGDFTGQRQSMENERLRNMQAAGQNERMLNQQGLDIGYQDFLRQQGYGKEQLGFYNSMLQGVPVAPGSTKSIYGGGPSEAEQALGLGIGGVGLYNAVTG